MPINLLLHLCLYLYLYLIGSSLEKPQVILGAIIKYVSLFLISEETFSRSLSSHLTDLTHQMSLPYISPWQGIMITTVVFGLIRIYHIWKKGRMQNKIRALPGTDRKSQSHRYILAVLLLLFAPLSSFAKNFPFYALSLSSSIAVLFPSRTIPHYAFSLGGPGYVHSFNYLGIH
jgi:hypothetical protein